MNNRLSVIVASYNYENYIRDTLQSLVKQTVNNFEIIVVDDGSEDNSIEVIESYKINYNNIKLFQHPDKKNHGLIASVKLGIEHATGEYIAFCESDDFWDKDHVYTLLKFIDNHKEGNIFCSEIYVINNSKNKNYNEYVKRSNQWLQKKSQKNVFSFLINNPIPTFSSVCIKKDILKSCDFNSYHPQYLDFWLYRQVCFENKIYYVNGCVTYWRKHDESYDMKENIKNINDFLIASNKLIFKKIKIKKKLKLVLFLKSIILSKRKFIKYQMKVLSCFIE